MRIGNKVAYRVWYDRKCSRRMANIEGIHDAVPVSNLKGKLHTGYIVGIRSVLMAQLQYHSPKQYDEDDFTPAYVSGKRENVYLVCKSIYNNPVIVRARDLVTHLSH